MSALWLPTNTKDGSPRPCYCGQNAGWKHGDNALWASLNYWAMAGMTAQRRQKWRQGLCQPPPVSSYRKGDLNALIPAEATSTGPSLASPIEKACAFIVARVGLFAEN